MVAFRIEYLFIYDLIEIKHKVSNHYSSRVLMLISNFISRFLPADTNLILREFEKCGVILKHVPGPRDANWMHILYQVLSYLQITDMLIYVFTSLFFMRFMRECDAVLLIIHPVVGTQ